ncbi:hypothetical protein I314_03461 [Cryptococcus bacillisporus CA1873]|uniref:Uncharacterized protein n=1 Tax=Cryptococcus bacillisporus CA1873 TaxID=1296111 RepID=A0ABR5BAV8_CRYGA|nr:hypothetical protein I314_03461 [Cryptococcus bacillisporus CA1873]|eukprot:KIR62517.1 hypothetical protein I314_03461 [Cryptococcus gattii CA1873]
MSSTRLFPLQSKISRRAGSWVSMKPVEALYLDQWFMPQLIVLCHLNPPWKALASMTLRHYPPRLGKHSGRLLRSTLPCVILRRPYRPKTFHPACSVKYP